MSLSRAYSTANLFLHHALPAAPAPSRHHPLLRLFEEAPALSNPYANPSPTGMTINLPSSFDTVRPTISIPSFEEMDGMAEPRTMRFGGGERSETPINLAAAELVSPATLRPNPFSWTTQSSDRSQSSLSAHADTSSSRPFGNASANGPPSPYLPPSPRWDRSQTPEDPWGYGSRSGTPTDAHFPDLGHNNYAPVTTSPSLPVMGGPGSGMDRPFTTRRRADTAPSSDFPPFGPGMPPMPKPTHSANTSVSSTGASSSGGSGFFNHGGLSASSTSSSGGFGPSGFSSGGLTASPPQANRPFINRARTATTVELDANRPFGNRSRKDSDALIRPGVPQRMASAIGGSGTDGRPRGDSLGQCGQSGFAFGRPRTPSDARPSGLHPKHGLKLQISTGPPPAGFASAAAGGGHGRMGSGSHLFAQNASVPASAPLYYNPAINGRDFALASSSMSKSSSAQGTGQGPPTASLTGGFPTGLDGATPLASAHNGGVGMGGFPFPDVASNDPGPPPTEAPPLVSLDAARHHRPPKAWPTGPALRPLDYARLTTQETVHDELERTIDELGQWLGVVDEGLSRILQE